MPYHLEKGATLQLMEEWLNGTPAEMRAVYDRLRTGGEPLDWMLTANLWTDPRFTKSPLGSGPAVAEAIARDWFGYEHVQGAWRRQDGPTTGYWTAYRGAVDTIVRRTLCWAMQIALGLEADGAGTVRQVPWAVELFWKCESPWFEGWVLSRPVDPPATTAGVRTNRGLVTVVFLTPAHRGSVVATSPIAVAAKATSAAFPHPVPSWENDYERVWPLPGYPAARAPKAVDRQHAMWVITHRTHVATPASAASGNNAAGSGLSVLDIPQLAVYVGSPPKHSGWGDVVVVSPSMPSGGVTHDGKV
jgi:hypothetical protein